MKGKVGNLGLGNHNKELQNDSSPLQFRSLTKQSSQFQIFAMKSLLKRHLDDLKVRVDAFLQDQRLSQTVI